MLNGISVLLADDHPVVRTGYRYLLEQAGYEVLESDSAENAYKNYQAHTPDVVIMDISMPGMGGIEGLKRLVARYPDVKILILSMYDDDSYRQNTAELGAKGYLSKDAASDELVIAVGELSRGKTYFKGQLTQVKNNRISTYNLSPRQFQIFRMLADGHSCSQISEELYLSVKTINNHRADIMKKLQLKNNVEISRFAIRHGVIEA